MKGHWLRHPPRVVVVATVAFLALVVGWSVLTPLAEAPDEPAHLGLILDVAQHHGAYPQFDKLPQKEGAFWICQTYAVSVKWCPTPAEAAVHAKVRKRPADAAPAKSSRPAWNARNFTEPVAGRKNQMPQHPPLYYELMAGALTVERAVTPGTWSVDHELAFLRLVDALMIFPLPFLAWATARRAGADDLVGAVAAVSLLGIPQLTHIGGALNNDNLFALVVGLVAFLLAGVARGDRSARTAALVGVGTALALLTKGFAIVIPPVVGLAYLLGERTRVASWWAAAKAALRPLVVAGAVTFVGAGWWYVGKLVTTSQLMPSIENHRLTSALKKPGFHIQFFRYLSSLVTKLVEGFWGAYGWRSVRLPVPLSVAATVGSLALVVVALRRARARGRSAGDARPTAAVLVVSGLPFLLFAAFVTIRSWVIYTGTSRLVFQQGRYLFAGLVGVALVTAVGATAVFGRRRVLPLATGAVVVFQAVGILAAYHGWWALTARSGLVQPVRAVVAWSGWPDPVALLFLFVAAVPLAWLLVSVARDGASLAAGPASAVADVAEVDGR